MANVTPRLPYDNKAIVSTTVITASSQQTNFPASRLRDPSRQKRWWSKAGWNVYVGFNDKLDFSEAGVARVATIATVNTNYATGADWAAAVQAAMNAAPGHTNTYTVTYDTGTKKITVARTSGTDALALLLLTGANVAQSCGRDLGFDTSANKTGSTSYTSDVVVYHSREFLLFDQGSALATTFAALLDHNMGTTGTVTLQGSTTNSWAAPTFTQVLAGDAIVRCAYFASQSQQWRRIIVDDISNVAGVTYAGVAFLGTYFEPGRSHAQGYQITRKDYSAIAYADHGALFRDKRQRARGWTLSFPRLSSADKDALEALADAVGVGGTFFMALDPQNVPADTRYICLMAEITHQQSPGDGATFDRFTPSIQVLEAL